MPSAPAGRRAFLEESGLVDDQIGVFATYVSGKGHAFLDRALYLPKSWTDKPERLAAAHVPHEIRFASKPSLATAMIGRALAAEVPFSWGAGDSAYGVGDLEMALRRAGKGFVLGANANHWFHSWRPDVMWVGEAREIIKTLPDEAWVRCSAGHGTKGERWYDWLYCPMADLHASEYSDTLTGAWTRGLLIRRNPADGDLRYFTTWCPQGTPLEILVRVEGIRWRIRRVSRPPKTNSVSLPTKRDPCTAGTPMSRWSCSHTR